MLNQLRFERNDFRKYVVRFHKIIIEKNKIINVLHDSKLIIKQANNIAQNYQKKNHKIITKNQYYEVEIVKERFKGRLF